MFSKKVIVINSETSIDLYQFLFLHNNKISILKIFNKIIVIVIIGVEHVPNQASGHIPRNGSVCVPMLVKSFHFPTNKSGLIKFKHCDYF